MSRTNPFVTESVFVFIFLMCLLPPSFAMASQSLPHIPARIFNIQKYGAIPDAVTDNSKAFQAAIRACQDAGGGVINVPAGRYLTGPIDIHSHMNLHLSSGAVILFSDDKELLAIHGGRYQPLLSVRNGTDIEITGKGIIDGQGASWWRDFLKAKKLGEVGKVKRPTLIMFDHCQKILIQGITLQNAPNFNLIPQYCIDVKVNDVNIRAPKHSPNTDGIDPSHCRDVTITKCVIDTGDDCIAIKSGAEHGKKPFGPCEHIRISDCVFLHGHGVSIGSDTASGVRDVVVEKCVFDGTDSGIRLKSERGGGGLVEDLTYRDITMRNVGVPIYITSYYPHSPKFGQPDVPQPVTATTPVWRDITIRNLTATDCKSAGIIVGLPEIPVSHITLEHVFISARKGMQIRYANRIQFIDTTIQPTTKDKPIRTEDVSGFKRIK